MNDMNLDFLSVGGRRYPIDLLNPLEALDLSLRGASVFGPALGKIAAEADLAALLSLDPETTSLPECLASLKGLAASLFTALGAVNSAEAVKLLHEALKRCYTPQNESLNSEAAFNAHFRAHPGDMHELGAKALLRLTRDFFPKPPAIGNSAFLKRMLAETAEASPSPPDGKAAPWPDGS